MKTDEELKIIARDIHYGKIFTLWHIREEQLNPMLGSIFLPIALGLFSNKSKEEINDVGLVYEYLSEAGPICVDGYPSFFSVRLLTIAETEKVKEYLKKFIQLEKTILDND